MGPSVRPSGWVVVRGVVVGFLEREAFESTYVVSCEVLQRLTINRMSAKASKSPLTSNASEKINFVEKLTKDVRDVKESIVKDYYNCVNMKIKMIDAWCVYCIATCIVQILYVVLVGTYPFNSFLAGLFCHIAMAAFGVSLRFTITSPDNDVDFKAVSLERASADFVFCHMVLFLIVFSFMG